MPTTLQPLRSKRFLVLLLLTLSSLTVFFLHRQPNQLSPLLSSHQPSLSAVTNHASTAASTPLYISYGHNPLLLHQTVASYLAAGWPAHHITVVDNTGTFDSNERGLLHPDSPRYLDYNHLRSLGVEVIRTPTLLTFAQVQNFFLHQAIERRQVWYFWSHQDVAVLGDYGHDGALNATYYDKVVELMLAARAEGVRFLYYEYDWLTWMETDALRELGGWDTSIPYYAGDCDLYSRYNMAGIKKKAVFAGPVFDLAAPVEGSVDGIERVFAGVAEEVASTGGAGKKYKALRGKLERMMREKRENKGGRNTWQLRGGKEPDGVRKEPFWREPGAEKWAFDRWSEWGREVYRKKWNTSECNLDGRGFEDAWALLREEEAQRKKEQEEIEKGER